jgi:hypothetical protein
MSQYLFSVSTVQYAPSKAIRNGNQNALIEPFGFPAGYY